MPGEFGDFVRERGAEREKAQGAGVGVPGSWEIAGRRRLFKDANSSDVPII
jgi:hypothetical protein